MVVYHDMKSFDKTTLKSKLAQKLAATDTNSYLNFEDTFMNILDKHGRKILLQTIKRERWKYYENLGLNNVTNNKKFVENYKTFSS